MDQNPRSKTGLKYSIGSPHFIPGSSIWVRERETEDGIYIDVSRIPQKDWERHIVRKSSNCIGFNVRNTRVLHQGRTTAELDVIDEGKVTIMNIPFSDKPRPWI